MTDTTDNISHSMRRSRLKRATRNRGQNQLRDWMIVCLIVDLGLTAKEITDLKWTDAVKEGVDCEDLTVLASLRISKAPEENQAEAAERHIPLLKRHQTALTKLMKVQNAGQTGAADDFLSNPIIQSQRSSKAADNDLALSANAISDVFTVLVKEAELQAFSITIARSRACLRLAHSIARSGGSIEEAVAVTGSSDTQQLIELLERDNTPANRRALRRFSQQA